MVTQLWSRGRCRFFRSICACSYAGSVEQVQYVGASGSGKATQTVTYTYDAFGRQATVTDASGTTTYSYDASGDLIQQQTPEGTINYGYDAVTGEHTSTYTASTETLYGYNQQGELTTVTVEELNGQTLSTPQVTSYTYDAAGNELTETLPDGELTSSPSLDGCRKAL